MSAQPLQPPARNRRIVFAAPLLTLVLLVVAGCSGESSEGGDDSADSAGATALTEEAPAPARKDAAASGSAASGGSTTLTSGLEQERKVVRTGSLTLSSTKVPQAREDVLDIADDLGGYLADERSTADHDGTLNRTRISIAVPTGRFAEAMDAIAQTGDVEKRRQSAEDVTQQVVDVDSRVKSAEASLRRVRLLLGRADKLADVIRLEDVMSSRQADLESLKAQQASLQKVTSTATIDVTLRTPDAPIVEPEQDKGFLAGLSAGWDSLGTAWIASTTLLGAVLPFAVLLALGGGGVAMVSRRRSHASSAAK